MLICRLEFLKLYSKVVGGKEEKNDFLKKKKKSAQPLKNYIVCMAAHGETEAQELE